LASRSRWVESREQGAWNYQSRRGGEENDGQEELVDTKGVLSSL
jgi:hypothetical protein